MQTILRNELLDNLKTGDLVYMNDNDGEEFEGWYQLIKGKFVGLNINKEGGFAELKFYKETPEDLKDITKIIKFKKLNISDYARALNTHDFENEALEEATFEVIDEE